MTPTAESAEATAPFVFPSTRPGTTLVRSEIFVVAVSRDSTPEEDAAMATAAGELGWELVTVVPDKAGLRWIFRRDLPPARLGKPA